MRLFTIGNSSLRVHAVNRANPVTQVAKAETAVPVIKVHVGLPDSQDLRVSREIKDRKDLKDHPDSQETEDNLDSQGNQEREVNYRSRALCIQKFNLYSCN